MYLFCTQGMIRQNPFLPRYGTDDISQTLMSGDIGRFDLNRARLSAQEMLGYTANLSDAVDRSREDLAEQAVSDVKVPWRTTMTDQSP